MTQTTSGMTLQAVFAGLNEGVHLLDNNSGPLTSAGQVQPEVEAAFHEEVSNLSPAARRRFQAAERNAALGGILRSPFFRNVTEHVAEIDATFDMLSDELSRQTLELIIRFRLLLSVFPLEFLNKALGGPLPQDRWAQARQVADARTDLPKGMNPWAIAFYWGLGVYSLPGLCAIEPGDAVLEVGAFVGDSTLYLASLCGPTGRIHAFELVPDNHAKLVANLALNDVTNVTAICQGMWDKVGKVAARFSAAGSRIDPDSSSEPTGNYALVNTIDNYCAEAKLERLDFIKIDAPSGAEEILRGAKQTLAHYRPRLAVNIHYNDGRDYADVPQFLREYLTAPYNYYLRHYARNHRYTIIYAAPVTT